MLDFKLTCYYQAALTINTYPKRAYLLDQQRSVRVRLQTHYFKCQYLFPYYPHYFPIMLATFSYFLFPFANLCQFPISVALRLGRCIYICKRTSCSALNIKKDYNTTFIKKIILMNADVR